MLEACPFGDDCSYRGDRHDVPAGGDAVDLRSGSRCARRLRRCARTVAACRIAVTEATATIDDPERRRSLRRDSPAWQRAAEVVQRRGRERRRADDVRRGARPGLRASRGCRRARRRVRVPLAARPAGRRAHGHRPPRPTPPASRGPAPATRHASTGVAPEAPIGLSVDARPDGFVYTWTQPASRARRRSSPRTCRTATVVRRRAGSSAARRPRRATCGVWLEDEAGNADPGDRGAARRGAADRAQPRRSCSTTRPAAADHAHDAAPARTLTRARHDRAHGRGSRPRSRASGKRPCRGSARPRNGRWTLNAAGVRAAHAHRTRAARVALAAA